MIIPIGSSRKVWCRAQRLAVRLLKDRRGVAAIEFSFIAPILVVMFFGTVEFSAAIAIKRDVTNMARTMSDLTSQAAVVTDFGAVAALFDLAQRLRLAEHIDRHVPPGRGPQGPTVGAYLLAFLVVGKPFNNYWGLLYAALLPMGLVRLPDAMEQVVVERNLFRSSRRTE